MNQKISLTKNRSFIELHPNILQQKTQIQMKTMTNFEKHIYKKMQHFPDLLKKTQQKGFIETMGELEKQLIIRRQQQQQQQQQQIVSRDAENIVNSNQTIDNSLIKDSNFKEQKRQLIMSGPLNSLFANITNQQNTNKVHSQLLQLIYEKQKEKNSKPGEKQKQLKQVNARIYQQAKSMSTQINLSHSQRRLSNDANTIQNYKISLNEQFKNQLDSSKNQLSFEKAFHFQRNKSLRIERMKKKISQDTQNSIQKNNCEGINGQNTIYKLPYFNHTNGQKSKFIEDDDPQKEFFQPDYKNQMLAKKNQFRKQMFTMFTMKLSKQPKQKKIIYKANLFDQMNKVSLDAWERDGILDQSLNSNCYQKYK